MQIRILILIDYDRLGFDINSLFNLIGGGKIKMTMTNREIVLQAMKISEIDRLVREKAMKKKQEEDSKKLQK